MITHQRTRAEWSPDNPGPNTGERQIGDGWEDDDPAPRIEVDDDPTEQGINAASVSSRNGHECWIVLKVEEGVMESSEGPANVRDSSLSK